jgi:predicted TPR repeat methyltransferase
VDPSEQARQRVLQARAARSVDETLASYREWAADYDRDVFDELGFVGSDRIADLLSDHLGDRTTPILDLGCGTGAVGSRLLTLGFRSIDGLDVSRAMLDVAARKGVYRALIEADLECPLAVASGVYGAAISAGTFTAGGVGPGVLAEVRRVLQPGATVAFVIGEWGLFEPALADWELLHVAEEPIRRGGPAEATMVVARVATSGQ